MFSEQVRQALREDLTAARPVAILKQPENGGDWTTDRVSFIIRDRSDDTKLTLVLTQRAIDQDDAEACIAMLRENNWIQSLKDAGCLEVRLDGTSDTYFLAPCSNS